LVDWVQLLHAFYSEEEYDIFSDALEDLPEDCPPGLVSALLSLHESEPEFVNEAVAVIGGHQCLTEVELRQLMTMREEPNEADNDAFNASKSGRASVAECANSTEGMLLELAADPRWEIRYRVAMNVAITQPVQETLLTAASTADDDGMGDYVLAALAVNRKTSQPVLELLAASASPMVRQAVALRVEVPDSSGNWTTEFRHHCRGEALGSARVVGHPRCPLDGRPDELKFALAAPPESTARLGSAGVTMRSRLVHG
jgi:hypothetical protein